MIIRSMTTSRRLMTNTALNMTNQALTAVINFMLVGFFLDTLGQEQYGLWILVGSIFSYRSLMSIGLNSAVNRHIPAYLATNDQDGIRRVVSTAYAYYIVPAAILIAATIVLYYNLESWFVIETALLSDARNVIVILGGSFAISLPFQVYSAVLSSYQRYDIINCIDILTMLLRTAIVVSLLSNNFGLIEMSITYGIAEMIIRLGYAISARYILTSLSLSLPSIDYRLMLQMMTYGVSTILYMSGSFLVFKSADLIIASLISTGAVSRFFVAVTPALLMIIFIQSFAQAMKPAVSDLEARKGHNKIVELALISQKYSLIAIIPSVAFLLIMGNAFLTIWVGDQFSEPGTLKELTLALQAVTLGVGIRLTQHTNFIVLAGKGTHSIFGFSALFMIATCICLAIGSIKIFDVGIVGVAWACSLPMIFVSIVVLPIHFSRKMKLSLYLSARLSWFPAAIVSIPPIGLLFIWNEIHTPQTWLEIIAIVITIASTSSVFAWLIALTPAERARFRSVFHF